MSQQNNKQRNQSRERRSRPEAKKKRINIQISPKKLVLFIIAEVLAIVGTIVAYIFSQEIGAMMIVVTIVILILYLMSEFVRNFSKYSIAMFILFMIIVVPILLGVVGLAGYGTKFSIYNEGWDGLSSLRVNLENEGYNITNGMSSLAVLNRLSDPGIVAVIGPAANYGTIDTISLVTFLAKGGSLVIADDYGTGAQIFDPLFSILNAWDDIADISDGAIPSLSDLFGFGGENQTGGPETLIFSMLGMLRGFAFNGSVLMDAETYTTNPAQPLLRNMETSNPLTEGISKGLQLEFGTVLSLAIKHNDSVTGEERTDWMPLQAISLEIFGVEIEDMFLPFLPFYTSRSAWMESDFQSAKDGNAFPDADEWGNVMFAPIMTLPIGLGKIVMIADPDIFINKWIDKPVENDNLIFSRNLFSYLASDINVTAGSAIPIIFDEGHAHQKFYSASVYSMAIMKFVTEMSMFPLYSPFIPLLLAVIAYPLIPKKTRLSPVLWTKVRTEQGKSRFEREIRRIVDSGAYSEAVGLLYRSMVRGLRKVSKQSMSSPEEIAEYLSIKDPSLKFKDLYDELVRINEYLNRPKFIPEFVFMRYMTFIKGLIDRL
ncbi:MAG: DUF4350 domain-containing protein [Candidatus Heimdallarchaeota archaeon]|nr:DUF4350 domain-containing protein [Candidatus Heimdallarchaeota archaeon]